MPKVAKERGKAGKDLEGMVCCITGTMSVSRANLTAAIKARGGDVASSFTRNVTHLISTEAEVGNQTTKVIAAQGKGVPIVSEEFFEACRKAKKIVPTKKYEIGNSASSSCSAAKAPAKTAATKKSTKKTKVSAKTAKAYAKNKNDGVPLVHPKVPAMFKIGSKVLYIEERDAVYDAELNQQEASSNTDKFYILQLLQHSSTSIYLFQHWGRTGTTGQIKVDEFDDELAAVADFVKKFKTKTGNNWDDRETFQQKSGKYNYLSKDYALSRDDDVAWQYHLTNDPYGKPDGWYDYDGNTTTEDSPTYNMENYHESFLSNSWLSIRFVESGQYTYKVDFDQMSQMNTTSQKSRPIRRHHHATKKSSLFD